MAKHDGTISHEELLKILDYNQDTGIFTWLHRDDMRSQWNGQFAGKIAGTRLEGCLQIAIHRIKYKAHRLAWFYITGKWPIAEIDHKDNNAFNNRFSNFREADVVQNSHNKKRARNNTSGFKGVSYCQDRGNYEARIKVGNKHLGLGRFDTPEEAYAAYCAAANKYFGEFARVA